jgi:hypothetical protein
MMKRALAVLMAAGAMAAPAAIPAAASAKACSGRYVHAVVGGQQKCLGAGEYCARRFERTYERHGFTCERVRGTLRLERD